MKKKKENVHEALYLFSIVWYSMPEQVFSGLLFSHGFHLELLLNAGLAAGPF